MSKLKPLLTLLGGTLILLGLIGLYLTLTTEGDLFFVLWQSDFSSIATFLLNWPWSLVMGTLLVHLGSGVHPVGHSYQLIEALAAQPSSVYESVRASLAEREVPGHRVRIYSQRQRGPFSPRRRSLRITSGYFRFDLCAAPFGKDFGVSWRCYSRMGLLERTLISIPALGWLLYFLMFRYTTYVEDRGLLFQSSVHQRIRDAINELSEEQGLRALSESEFQPILADMFRRWR